MNYNTTRTSEIVGRLKLLPVRPDLWRPGLGANPWLASVLLNYQSMEIFPKYFFPLVSTLIFLRMKLKISFETTVKVRK